MPLLPRRHQSPGAPPPRSLYPGRPMAFGPELLYGYERPLPLSFLLSLCQTRSCIKEGETHLKQALIP